ncbi:glycoside hydrolase family 2 TIM barrel-domain containing protein [Mangrovimonas sp. ST2L15]|uniref:glycoside hydrolase family 2 TIM barrel-domain containing protein n=1 Tax=Mangrovimonas sp. ST2L15 TaxID=1645916 RepID=UPI000AC65790|nr:glycoside hydrolase family 2 TIM barrel-domain containing protein [Mangrovimonas sp. ST2L15]
MRRKGFIIVCLLLLVIVIGTLLFLKSDRGHKMSENAAVRVVETNEGYELLKNGKPFYIKGASGDGYIQELVQAGGNTIRLYDTINTTKQLDVAYQKGVSVILDIPLPDYGRGKWTYSDDQGVKNLTTYVQKYVNKHKNHPALLYWNLGNELIYPLTIFPNRFTETVNDLIDLIHEEDPNHPIATTVAGTSRAQTLGIHLHSPKFDLIGYNVFGSVKILDKTQNQLSYFLKLKPYYISEWGDQGPWEANNEYWFSIQEKKGSEKARGYFRTYQDNILNNHSMLGSTAFYWGQKFEGTPDWFNIFDEKGYKSPIYYALKSSWEKTDLIYPLEIVYLKFKNLSSKDNRIFRPEEPLEMETLAQSNYSDSLTYEWNLYKESSSIYEGWKLLSSEFNLKGKGEEINFNTPEEEGAYRMVLRVYDNQQNYSTANISFYVLNPNDKKE